MSARDEDEAWKAIVDNYGERPVLDDSAPATPAPDPGAGPDLGATPFPHPSDEVHGPDEADEVDERPPADPEDRFVPPVPPPLPRTTPLRTAAWAGVIGGPTLLLLLALVDVTVPVLVLLALVAAFVGGFLYLVATMGQEPRDPWDNGARV